MITRILKHKTIRVVPFAALFALTIAAAVAGCGADNGNRPGIIYFSPSPTAITTPSPAPSVFVAPSPSPIVPEPLPSPVARE